MLLGDDGAFRLFDATAGLLVIDGHPQMVTGDGLVTFRFVLPTAAGDREFPDAAGVRKGTQVGRYVDAVVQAQRQCERTSVQAAVAIIRTPVQAPNANAFAERWIRSVREECLDKLLILGERHLHRVLTAYVDYYNHARPHQGIDQQCPVPLVRSTARNGPVERRDVLGSVLHDYFRCAA